MNAVFYFMTVLYVAWVAKLNLPVDLERSVICFLPATIMLHRLFVHVYNRPCI
jgi:hypothetical protein